MQHAYEIFALGINEPALNISLIAFPNPTMGNLTLQISTQQTNGSKMNDKIKHCLQHLCLPLNQIQTDKHSIKLLVRGKNIRFF